MTGYPSADSAPAPHNILLVRTDRIGDVVLSMPAARFIKARLPQARVSFLTRAYNAPLAELAPDIDEVLVDPEAGVGGLARQLAAKRFDAAVLLHPTGRLALALWTAGIPVRAGTAYRLYSLLFNRRVRQHRRHSLRHELEHNVDLAAQGLGLPSAGQPDYPPPRLDIPIGLAAAVTAKVGLNVEGGQRSLIVVHPGSGGSARDWPLERFAKLIDALQDEKPEFTVAVTLGPGEEALRGELEPRLTKKPAWVTGLDLKELAALLSRAKLIIANSTGPLHIATAVGAKALGLYCPMVPCHPKRWGPYGTGHRALMPEVELCRKCTGAECRHYDCMEGISLEQVLSTARDLIGTS